MGNSLSVLDCCKQRKDSSEKTSNAPTSTEKSQKTDDILNLIAKTPEIIEPALKKIGNHESQQSQQNKLDLEETKETEISNQTEVIVKETDVSDQTEINKTNIAEDAKNDDQNNIKTNNNTENIPQNNIKTNNNTENIPKVPNIEIISPEKNAVHTEKANEIPIISNNNDLKEKKNNDNNLKTPNKSNKLKELDVKSNNSTPENLLKTPENKKKVLSEQERKEQLNSRKAEFEKKSKNNITSLAQYKQNYNKKIENPDDRKETEKKHALKEIKEIEKEESASYIPHSTLFNYIQSSAKKFLENDQEKEALLKEKEEILSQNDENEKTKKEEKEVNSAVFSYENKKPPRAGVSSLGKYGRKINKNLLDRVQMLESLFSSKPNEQEDVPGTNDRTRSDETNTFISNKILKKENFQRQYTENIGNRFEHLNMERGLPKRKLKNQSSLVSKSLDFNNL